VGRKEKVAQPEDADQAALVVGHVEVLHVVFGVPVPLGFQVLLHLADEPALAIGQELGHHDAAGHILRVGEQSPDVLGLLGRHLLQDRLGPVRVEVGQEIRLMVALHLVDDCSGLLDRQVLHEIRSLRPRDVFEEVGRVGRLEQQEQPVLVVTGQT